MSVGRLPTVITFEIQVLLWGCCPKVGFQLNASVKVIDIIQNFFFIYFIRRRNEVQVITKEFIFIRSEAFFGQVYNLSIWVCDCS